MITLITPKLKDDLLADLMSVKSMNVENNIHTCAKDFDTTPDIVEAIYDQFQEMGLLKQTKFLGGTIFFQLNAKAHGFYSHGGFMAQEEMLKANIQKLSNELDLLAKQLSPDLLEKASSISAIGANIIAALAFFKT